MKIAVDAMGSDARPVPDVQGAVEAAREYNIGILLVGPETQIRQELKKIGSVPAGVEICNATQEIAMNEHPANAVREKKDSTIVVGIQQVKLGNADAYVSMGHTGANLAAAIFELQRIKGVHRPALGALFPTPQGPSLLIDVGANTDCKPEWLDQFGVMGESYVRGVLRIEQPRVALLSNGEEEIKGNQAVQEAHALLKQRAAKTGMNFIGNVEGKDVAAHLADVIVADGFVGNIALKTAEGIAKMLNELIRSEIKANPISTVGGALAMPAFNKVKKILDYTEYGGAPLLGVNGVVIVGHGRSNAVAVKNAVRAAKRAVEANILAAIRSGVTALD
ncbi:MAG: phosphate acyltransferase PlsX [Chloroflexota bacterium]|nr:MAG: phosphate acyltransferase PlsX [Chloroflexota bacterium]